MGPYWPVTAILNRRDRSPLLRLCWSSTGCFSIATGPRQYWTVPIFLDTDCYGQCCADGSRDGVPIDSQDPRVASYVGDQRINLTSCDPASRASLVIENTD